MQEQYLVDNPAIAQNAEVYSDPGYADAEKALVVDDRSLKAQSEPDLAPVDVDLEPIEV